MSGISDSGSSGTREWLAATRGWTIRAYVDSGSPFEKTETMMGRPASDQSYSLGQSTQKKRPELPFGENIRDTIRSLKGK